MQPSWDILHAMLHCRYKAWQLGRGDEQVNVHSIDNGVSIKVPIAPLSPIDKLVLTALYQGQSQIRQVHPDAITITYDNQQTSCVRLRLNSKKAQTLFTETFDTINSNNPPAFYKNAHCPECKFHDTCYQKLKERDCISLLSGMSSKVILKFHKKGIYSIAQLSHLFRPRRRRRHPQVSTNYLWELKALAITEQKTFVLYPPDVKPKAISIYLDF